MKSLYLFFVILLCGCQAQPVKQAATSQNQQSLSQSLATQLVGCPDNFQNSHLFNNELLSVNQQRIVIEQGKKEPRGIGSFSIRLYGANPQFPYDDFLDGLIRMRDGSVSNIFIDQQQTSDEVIVVEIQSSGSGGYKTQELFKIKNNKIEFIETKDLSF
ncbi:PliI family lysozyme inhibitor of I-type lysozyme [Pelagibaculum spongiae]|uniref:Lipoprotein n=1 Tax=Pelagibaculum spongiae TaxID=2080658 RepID=A0A2V1GZ29_9GAMM|nr:PliI family lysozyme inhibitor of I-type lysozyme [Pelagibaculum spongiae]PVZ68245.1 hypothetical protein DC094_13185 [Pelagibaculum spongiae]